MEVWVNGTLGRSVQSHVEEATRASLDIATIQHQKMEVNIVLVNSTDPEFATLFFALVLIFLLIVFMFSNHFVETNIKNKIWTFCNVLLSTVRYTLDILQIFKKFFRKLSMSRLILVYSKWRLDDVVGMDKCLF